MIDVTVRVEGKGVEGSDFDCEAEVRYYRVKNREDFNMILRVVAESLFSLDDLRKQAKK